MKSLIFNIKFLAHFYYRKINYYRDDAEVTLAWEYDGEIKM